MGGNSTTTTLGGWLMAGAVVVGWAFGTFDRALRQVETAAIAQEPSQAGEPSRESSFAGTLKSQVGADSDRAATDHLLPPGPDRGEFPHLHNLLRVSRLIYCGGEPTGEAAFADLARLGIKTVVSVDGARPNLELAKKYGLRYVHIPIGYDGISEAAGLALASLVRHADGPYYIHCHHGQHRGPAAAAVACVAAGVASGAEAVAILEQAGTSKSYHGLWRDVVHYASPAVGVPLPKLVEIAPLDSITEAMANIDRAMDHLKLCQQAGWMPPKDHPDILPQNEALLVKEGFREIRRHLPGDRQYDARFRQWNDEAERMAAALESALAAQEQVAANQAFGDLRTQCVRCHQAYRD